MISVFLFFKAQNKLILSFGIGDEKKPLRSWDENIHNSKTKISSYLEKPWKYGDSYVHKVYEPKIVNDDVFFLIFFNFELKKIYQFFKR